MIIGIDPGMSGAIAMLYSANMLFIEDIPTLGKEINGAAIAGIFREFDPKHIYIEAQNSHLMGRQSAFNFGQGLGVINGVMATLAISYTRITPAKWKQFYGLKRDKDASRATATRLFPKEAELFKRKKDDGRAEAALIALYGMTTLGETR
jgi:crossover junction endodeoxyribonuclease RuvC